MEFEITHLYDGNEKSEKNGNVSIKLKDTIQDGCVSLEINAPFYNDPAPTNCIPGQPLFKLWEYEVVEAFFLSTTDRQSPKYLEVEFGPHGQHLALLLDGKKNIILHSMPMTYSSVIDWNAKTWQGFATIPLDHFPPNVGFWNAYSIHGGDEPRIYEALYPVRGSRPDFHKIDDFQPLKWNPVSGDKPMPEIWTRALQSPMKVDL